jgi:dCTP deaminase
MSLTDCAIRARCVACEENGYKLDHPPMIEPFSEGVRKPGTISYGLSHRGYDIRLSGVEAWVLNPSYGEVVDPKRMYDPAYRERIFTKRTFLANQAITVPANGYILGVSYERFRMPRDLMGTCLGKSTYARCGLIVNVTPLEPGWEGSLTVEIANTGGMPVMVYAMEGIAQIQFWPANGRQGQDYAEKGGLYMSQEGVTAARV